MIIRSVTTPADPFARQRLIPGWEQQRVEHARILLAGVGALGNACADNLVKTGVRHLIVVDNDIIETSNLSRTVLFRPGDEGRRKVAVARERLEALAPARAHVIDLDADVVWGLGWGVYRRVDLVLVCVDSVEARAAVGGPAWSLGVTAVEGGIFGFDGRVVVQGIGDGPCIACAFDDTDWAERGARYSCDQVRRLVAPHALVPATQGTASLIGALMSNEALHLLHGDMKRTGVWFSFSGKRSQLLRFVLRRRPQCPAHTRITAVRESESSARTSAGTLVERLAREHGADVRVDLGRDFLVSTACKGCGRRMPLARPRHATTERDLICDRCWKAELPAVGDPSLEVARVLCLASPRHLLDMTLEDLGIPPLHLLAVEADGVTSWLELTGDVARVLPRWPLADGSQRAASVKRNPAAPLTAAVSTLAIRRSAPIRPTPSVQPPIDRLVVAEPNASVRVFVTATAMRRVWTAVAIEDGFVERGGALAGRYCVDSNGQRFIVITHPLPAPDAPSSSCHIEIRPSDWLEITRRRLAGTPGARLLGWYHSHPDLWVAMSRTDRETQRALFNADWQVGLVVDPVSRRFLFHQGGDADPARWVAIVREGAHGSAQRPARRRRSRARRSAV